jgi:hypothetical protein
MVCILRVLIAKFELSKNKMTKRYAAEFPSLERGEA